MRVVVFQKGRELDDACGEVVDVDYRGDDARLISASLSDPAAFAGIFDRHAPELLGYVIRRVGMAEGEAVLGELFRVAFESRNRYDLSRADARPWLYGIAANLVLKHYRSAGRHRAALERLAQRRESTPVPFDERIVDEVAITQLWSRLSSAIDDLPDHDREVLFLYAWQNLSYAEIAEALDIPVGTVRSRLNRVRTALRELRESSGEEPDDTHPRAQGGAVR